MRFGLWSFVSFADVEHYRKEEVSLEAISGLTKLWTGLQSLGDLFFALPADLLAALLLIFGVLVGVGIKRIFMS